MKFTTSTSVKKPVAKAVKLPTQAELRNSYLNLCAVTGRLKEVDMLIDNMTMAISALSRKDATAETIRVLNIDKGLESMLGVAEKAITKQMALEGLGQSIREGWNKLVEFITKCVAAIRDFVGKLFQTSGHMIRTVKANIDKVDFNAKLNIPSKSDADRFLVVGAELSKCVPLLTAKLCKIEPKGFSDREKELSKNPIIKNVKDVCDKSNGMLVFDESSGEVTLNTSFEMKEQSLAEAGYSKKDLGNLFIAAEPEWLKTMAGSFIKVTQALNNYRIDKVGAVASTAAGVVSQNAEEATANFIRSYKTVWNVLYSSYRVLLKIGGFDARIVAQAYKTLPAELKKHI